MAHARKLESRFAEPGPEPRVTSAFRVVLGPDSGALGSALSLAMLGPETLARIERFPDGESRVSMDPPVRG